MRAARIDAPTMSWSGALPAVAFLAAWGALYLPAYLDFADGEWAREANAHQPFILAVAAGAAYAILRRPDFRHYADRFGFYCGVAILALGLGVYAVGRLGEATLFVSASQGIVAAGAAVAVYGFSGAGRLWFPLGLSLYLIVWPSWALDALTAPLKRFVSSIASEALYAAGSPVAHAGAVITAGPYRLLVADACAGLNSLLALTAVGAVYLYVVRRRSLRANALVVAALVPIAVLANILRVMLLVLITHRLGYDAGQSFLHDVAGLATFALALGLVFAVDSLAAGLWEKRR